MFITNGVCFNRPFFQVCAPSRSCWGNYPGVTTKKTRRKRARKKKMYPNAREADEIKGHRKTGSGQLNACAQGDKEGEREGCFPLFNYYKLIIFFL